MPGRGRAAREINFEEKFVSAFGFLPAAVAVHLARTSDLRIRGRGSVPLALRTCSSSPRVTSPPTRYPQPRDCSATGYLSRGV